MSGRADSAGVTGCVPPETQLLTCHGILSRNAASTVDAYAVDNLVTSRLVAGTGYPVTGGITAAR